MFKNIKLGIRIYTGFAIILVILIGICLFAYQGATSVGGIARLTRDESAVYAMLAKDMKLNTVQVQQWLTDISASGAAEGFDDGYDEAEKNAQKFMDGIEQFRTMFQREQDELALSELVDLEQKFDAYYSMGKTMAAAYIEQGRDAGNQAMAEFDSHATAISEATQRLVETENEELNQSMEGIISESDQLKTMIGVVGISAFLVSLALAWTITRSITNPINGIVSMLKTMTEGDGDLSLRLDESRKDELGQISLAVNSFVLNIQKISEMMRQLPLNVMFCDPEFNLVYMNDSSSKTLKGMEKNLPFKVDDMIGKSIDAFHKSPSVQRRMLSDYKNNLPRKIKLDLYGEDVELQADVVEDQEGNVLGFMAGWRVITEQEEAKKRDLEQKESLEALFAEQEEAKQRDLEQKESLESLLSNVASSSTEIDQGAQQIAGASQSLSEGAAEQASSLEEISSSLEEMSSMIDQNAENCNQAATLSGECQQSAGKGQNEMIEMASAVDEIKKSSSEISKIIKVIDEIAFQTNLLALNAAVEAARAGEAGKGFAVVAEEVRNLAQRSAEAAKNTSAMIEESTQRADNGVVIAQRVGEALEEIAGSTQKVNSLVAEIASASQEQAEGIGQVNKGINELDRVTQQNAGNAEELAAGAQETAAQVASLRDLTNQGGSEVKPPPPTSIPHLSHGPAALHDLQHSSANDPPPSKRELVPSAHTSREGDDDAFPLDNDDSLTSF